MIKNTHFIEKIARFKIYMGTGLGYVSDFKYPFMLAVGLKVYLPNSSNLLLGLISLLALLIVVFTGWFDLKYIHLSQTVASISTREFNPYFNKLEKNINKKI